MPKSIQFDDKLGVLDEGAKLGTSYTLTVYFDQNELGYYESGYGRKYNLFTVDFSNNITEAAAELLLLL